MVESLDEIREEFRNMSFDGGETASSLLGNKKLVYMTKISRNAYSSISYIFFDVLDTLQLNRKCLRTTQEHIYEV